MKTKMILAQPKKALISALFLLMFVGCQKSSDPLPEVTEFVKPTEEITIEDAQSWVLQNDSKYSIIWDKARHNVLSPKTPPIITVPITETPKGLIKFNNVSYEPSSIYQRLLFVKINGKIDIKLLKILPKIGTKFDNSQFDLSNFSGIILLNDYVTDSPINAWIYENNTFVKNAVVGRESIVASNARTDGAYSDFYNGALVHNPSTSCLSFKRGSGGVTIITSCVPYDEGGGESLGGISTGGGNGGSGSGASMPPLIISDIDNNSPDNNFFYELRDADTDNLDPDVNAILYKDKCAGYNEIIKRAKYDNVECGAVETPKGLIVLPRNQATGKSYQFHIYANFIGSQPDYSNPFLKVKLKDGTFAKVDISTMYHSHPNGSEPSNADQAVAGTFKTISYYILGRTPAGIVFGKYNASGVNKFLPPGFTNQETERQFLTRVGCP